MLLNAVVITSRLVLATRWSWNQGLTEFHLLPALVCTSTVERTTASEAALASPALHLVAAALPLQAQQPRRICRCLSPSRLGTRQTQEEEKVHSTICHRGRETPAVPLPSKGTLHPLRLPASHSLLPRASLCSVVASDAAQDPARDCRPCLKFSIPPNQFPALLQQPPLLLPRLFQQPVWPRPAPLLPPLAPNVLLQLPPRLPP